jgi:hypothetical protein
MNPLSAVITADIVRSTAMPAGHLRALSDRLRLIAESNTNGMHYFYRGDSFQLYLEDPAQAYGMALILRTETRLSEAGTDETPADLRLSIGVGRSEDRISEINTARGEAFLISGRGLDELGKSERRMKMATGNSLANTGLAAISLFTDHLFEKLTRKQAQVLQHMLRHRTQTETAEILGKSQPTVNRHLRSLGWQDLEQLLGIYDDIMNQLQEQYG